MIFCYNHTSFLKREVLFYKRGVIMTKYHPLYAYAVVSVVLILGIQMILAGGPQGITGLAVGDQSGQQQGGTQQGGQQGQGASGGDQGFFQKIGNFFGGGDKDTTGQAGTAAQGNKKEQGKQGTTG